MGPKPGGFPAKSTKLSRRDTAIGTGSALASVPYVVLRAHGHLHPVRIDQPAPASARSTDDRFLPRLRRAVIILMAAVAAHVWVVRAPQTEGVTEMASARAMSAGRGFRTAAVVPVQDRSLPAAGRGTAVTVNTIVIEAPVVHMPAAPPSMNAGAAAPRRVQAEAGLRSVAHETIGGTARDEARQVPVADQPEESTLASLTRGGVPPPARSASPMRVTAVPPSFGRSIPIADVTTPPGDAVADGATDRDVQKQLVRALLDEYSLAYERLDARAAKAVFPSADARALQRAFQQLESQRMRFAECEISMSGRQADAHCRGDYAYTPRVGHRREQRVPREWKFNLARSADRWQIVRVNSTYH